MRTAHGITSEKRVDAYTLEKKEHICNTKVFKSGSNIATHAWLEGHTIDFENARVIEAIQAWNPGTLQLLARQTKILSSC